MSDYAQYQKARDVAWRALLELPEKKLPVDVDALAKKLGVEIHPFPGKEQALLHNLVNRAADGPCVSLRIRRAWHIFLRANAFDESHRRFAVAHELGHLLLDHDTETLAPGVRCFAARESTGDVLEDTQEMDDYYADIFAIRLLAPAFALHEMHIDTSGGIMRLCGLPPHAAVVRAMRMEVLNERDAFYRDILETRARNAFMPWLNGARFPEAAAQLRYASESVPVMEIHGYPKERQEAEESAQEAESSTFIPEKPLSLPTAPSRSGMKTMLRFFFYRNRRKILLGAAVLVTAILLYFVGRTI